LCPAFHTESLLPAQAEQAVNENITVRETQTVQSRDVPWGRAEYG